MTKRRPIIIGNWKMHKTQGESLELARAIRNVLGSLNSVDVGIAPPFTALSAVARQNEQSKLLLCAQDCSPEDHGAFTGEISVPMLKDIGCTHVIVGHSERRQIYGESDELINRKVKAVYAHGLTPVLCIGELLGEREASQTFEVVKRQLGVALAGVAEGDASRIIVAYEPVWAIGTGKVATTAQAQEVHAFLRGQLKELYSAELADAVRIQYGGSMKADNASGLLGQPDVDGGLVGGASLKPEAYIGILKCA